MRSSAQSTWTGVKHWQRNGHEASNWELLRSNKKNNSIEEKKKAALSIFTVNNVKGQVRSLNTLNIMSLVGVWYKLGQYRTVWYR